MAEDSPERYVNEKTGRSTEHAEKVATRFNKNDLIQEVSKNLPDRTKLNWKDSASPYTVKSGDTGILEILKSELKDGKLDNKDFLRLSYGHMFKTIDEVWKNRPGAALNPKTNKPKVYTINFIQPGDQLYVKNGNLVVRRVNNDYYAGFSVDLYPWPKTTITVEDPQRPTPPKRSGTSAGPLEPFLD